MKQTLIEDLKNYLEYKKAYLRANSYKVYQQFGDLLIEYLTANNLLELQTKKVTPVICEQFKVFILKKYTNPTTRNKHIGQMKGFFYQFVKAGWERYKISPAQNVELLPKQDSNLHEPYSEKEVSAIIEKIIEKKDYFLLLYIYFIYYTFSRPGREVRFIKVGDIKRKILTIPAKNSKNRKVKNPTITKPIDQLLDLLNICSYPADWYIFGTDGKPGPVACGSNTYYNRHRQILRELELDQHGHTLYGWKHTGNIRAVSLGINGRELQQQNGFSDFRTLEIYLRRLSAYSTSEIYSKFN